MKLNFPSGFSGRMIMADGSAITPDIHNQITLGVNVDPQPYINLGFTMVQGVVTTATRPTVASAGTMLLDTTLGIPIWRNAAETLWVNSAGATV
jgi:hypothetical protein